MKKLLNTLFVTTQGVVLHREGETIDVRKKGGSLLKMPIHLLSGVVCFGAVTVTPSCMQLCVENGVLVSFLTEYGRFQARVVGPVSGNVLLRKAQYRFSDDLNIAADIARRAVTAKVANCRTVLLRARRDHPQAKGVDEIEKAAEALGRIVARLKNPEPLDDVRGREGDAAAVFEALKTKFPQSRFSALVY